MTKTLSLALRRTWRCPSGGTWLADSAGSMLTRFRTCLLVVLALGGFAAPCVAQTFTWTGAQNANWSIGNNWAGGVAPSGAMDSSVGGANTISKGLTFAATRTIVVNNAASTLTVSGVITGAGGITKAGAGTLVLSAIN